MALIKYFCILFWASLSMVCGLFLFTNGFFITKNTIVRKNNCTLMHNDTFDNKDPLSVSTECLKPRARVIMLIVDALKYEFTLKFDSKEAAGTYYRNKLPVISETLQKYPNNSKLFKFVADPPTTTMQRLKALTTGTMPTFIEINKNFEADKIQEDNLIDQNKLNGNIVMGDSTWSKLYPKQFLRDHTVYSFDVFDLDTVDKSVKRHIFTETENKDWSLLIAHLLGIDHCGHVYGMNHPQMLRKLSETNIFIKDLLEKINDSEADTVLFVMGDHGMTESGDHGGESPDETDAAMFVYSTLPLLSLSSDTDVKSKSTVKQVDIVPTISVILGIPIPFANIGSLIIEALPIKKAIKNLKSSELNFILHSLWRNIIQVQNYIDDYSRDNTFTKVDQLEEIKQTYSRLIEQAKLAELNQDLNSFINNANEYFSMVKNLCYDEWVQYDNNLMARGMLVLFCSLFSLFIIITGLIGERMHSVLQSSFLTCLFAVVMISLATSAVLYLLRIIADLANALLFSCGLSSIICFAFLVIQNWDYISDSWYEQSKRKKGTLDLLARFVFVTSVFGVFSNSYILEENKILSFFVVSAFFFLLYSMRCKNVSEGVEKKGKGLINSNKKTLLYTSTSSIVLVFVVCTLIRISNVYWRHRPEYIDRMKDGEANGTLLIIGKMGSIVSEEKEIYFTSVAIVTTVVYYVFIKLWLQKCGNLSGYSPSAILNTYLTKFVLVFTACYWISRLKYCSRIGFKSLNFVPILIYAMVSGALCVTFCWPLSVYLLATESRAKIEIKRDEATVPRLFEKIKNSLYLRKTEDKSETPIVYGLGTVYSACFISLSAFLCLLYILLLGFVIAPSVVLMNVVCVALLYVSAMDRVCNASSLEEIVRVPNLALLCWFLVAEYFFFATGHQATFSSIHWDAGFIGIDGSLPSVMTLRAVLIVINTFGSHVILGVMLPLLIIAPFTLRFVFPHMTKASKIHWEDIKRGELLLFHNSPLFHSEIFSICGKYILFHACKVFACMLAATVHSRHLMVWGIFAPKLIFQGIGFLVTLGSVLTSLLLLVRIESSIEKFYSQIA